MNRSLLHIGFIAALCLSTGCAKNTRDTPVLDKPPPSAEPQPVQSAPPQKNWMEKTGEAAWGVVQMPVRLVTPVKNPQTPPADDSEPPQAVDAIIIQRYPSPGPKTAPTPAPAASEPAPTSRAH